MKKNIIQSIFFIILFIFLLLLSSNLTFKYASTLEEINPHMKWEFIKEKFIPPDEVSNYLGKGNHITIPHQFIDEYQTPQTYGTYITKFTLPSTFINKKMGIFIPFEYGSYELYINDELILEKGRVAANKEDYDLRIGPAVGNFTSSTKDIFITLHFSNYSSIRGGFAKPIQIGEYEELLAQHYTSITIFFFTIGLIFILGLFLLRFSIVQKNNISSYLLASICIAFATRSFFARPFVYSITTLDIRWDWAVKIEAFSTIVIMILFIRLFQEMISPYVKREVFVLAYLLTFAQGLLVLFTAPLLFQQTFIYFFLIHLYYIPYCIFIFLKKYTSTDYNQKMQFYGILLLALTALHDVFVVYYVLNQMMLIQFAIIIYAFLQILIVTKKYETNLEEVLLLNKEITSLNVSLEEKVARRTKELELLASQDALTGIANRHVFDKGILYYFKRTFEQNKPLTLFIMDLDNFKQYNDTYGHQAGDELLKAIVTTVEYILPSSATFARYGGEEFAILIEDAEVDIVNLGHKIVSHVEAQQFKHAHCTNAFATISLGAYQITYGHNLKYPNDLIIAADQQLYKAKKAGKNKFMFAKNRVGYLYKRGQNKSENARRF